MVRDREGVRDKPGQGTNNHDEGRRSVRWLTRKVTMSFCGSCGSEAVAGDRFCQSCGNPPIMSQTRVSVATVGDVKVLDKVLVSTAPADWHEPSLHAHLRWGSYSQRYAIGLGLVLIDLVARAPITAMSASQYGAWGAIDGLIISFAAISALVIIAGFFVLPATGRARAWAIPLVTLALLADATFLMNPQIYYQPTSLAESTLMISSALLALLAWSRLRERSVGATFIALGALLAFSFVLLYLSGNLLYGGRGLSGDAEPAAAIMIAVEMVALVGAAWLTRVVDPPLRAAGERRSAIRAYSSVGRSADMATGSLSGQGPASLNTCALLSLIFALIGAGVVSVVLGHIARHQLSTSAERGSGMALTGLIIGYVQVVASVCVLVVYVIVLTQVLQTPY